MIGFHVEPPDDRVFWHGHPEIPQPKPKALRWWVTLLLTLALGAVALGVALIL